MSSKLLDSECSPETTFVADSRTSSAADVFDMLVALCSPESNFDLPQRSSLDWNDFIEKASYHGVLPIVADRLLANFTGLVPVFVRDRLRRAAQINALKNFRLVEEIFRIVDAFRTHGLRVMPYKGPVMAEYGYGDLSLRDCADLDFLVPRAEIESAAALLTELGYQSLADLPDHLRDAFVRNGAEEQFRHRETGLLVELQWTPAPAGFNVRFDESTIWDDSCTLTLGSAPLLIPSDTNLFALLALHGWKHNWSRLIWVSDVAQLIHRRQIDWKSAIDSAKRSGYLRILLLAAHLACTVFKLAVPHEIAGLIHHHPQVSRCASALETRLRHSRVFTYFEWHRYMLAVRDSKSDAARHVFRFFSTPGLGEYRSIRLPRWATPAFRLVRLGRVLNLLPAKSQDT